MVSRGQYNGRSSVNFRAYCLNVRPQVYLSSHYVQTYPIYSTAEQLEPFYKLFPATDKAQIEWWLSLHSSTRCQTTLMLWWLQLDSPWTPCRVHTQLRLSCMYICSWHDGSIKSENVLTKSFMLCHLLILTSVMWLAQQALDLSFYVVACHNDRQVLNNYFEPWVSTDWPLPLYGFGSTTARPHLRRL